MKKIDMITLTIDSCDYCYKVINNTLQSYWCDCPIEFDINLAESLIAYVNFVNKMLEDEQYEIKEKTNERN